MNYSHQQKIVIPIERNIFLSNNEHNNVNENIDDSASKTNTNNDDNNLPKPTIVVDMREFKSDLPSYLHHKGTKIDPMTLEVFFFL